MADCVVVGGGLIGMLTARELAREGLSVQVVERGSAGREASWAGGGIISPLYPWRYPDAISLLAKWGQPRYEALAEALEQESGIDPEWTPNGMLVLDQDETEQAVHWARRFEARVEVVDGREVAACEPAVGAGLPRGLWMPDVAQIRNPRLVKAARGALAACGVGLQEGVEVLDLLVANGRVQGVQTPGGRIQAERVVVAAGAWSSKLLQAFGLRVNVIPVRGQMILFRAHPGLVRRMILKGGHYLIPRRDGRILAGSTLEYVGYDKATTEPAKAELHQAAVELVPALEAFEIEHQWSGLRPAGADDVPLIGEVPGIAGLFLNTGHFRNGVVLAPASVRLLADLVLGRSPILPPEPYSLARPQA